jgi:hypothetical protein
MSKQLLYLIQYYNTSENWPASLFPCRNWRNITWKELMKLKVTYITYHLCGIVVRVPGYRSRDPGSIPSATRSSEKYWVWNRVHSALWVQLRSYLEEKVVAPVKKSKNTAVGIRHTDHMAPSICKRWHWLCQQVAVARSV